MFECLYPGAVAYSWFVNGVEGSSSDFPPEIKETGGTSGNPSVLTIPATSQFNNSVVQCGALSFSGGVLSRNATLMIGECIVMDYFLAKVSHFFLSQSKLLLKRRIVKVASLLLYPIILLLTSPIVWMSLGLIRTQLNVPAVIYLRLVQRSK